MKVSYDVTFVPMTNVVIDTDNPLNPSEEQQTEIARLAAKKIAESFHEKISCENLAEIRLHEIDGKEAGDGTVFDNGCRSFIAGGFYSENFHNQSPIKYV